MYNNKNNQEYVLSSENVQTKIFSLLIELQEKTGVSDEELDEFKKLLNLVDTSEDVE